MRIIGSRSFPARIAALVALVLLSSVANASLRHHLDLEMTGAEYAQILDEHPQSNFKADALDPILALGTRNLALLVELNRHRDQAHQISLSSKETEIGYPIDAPREINEKLSLAEYANLTATMPQALLSILLSTEPLPTNLPVNDATYIEWGFKTDRVYQMAVRWMMERNDLGYFAQARRHDIRGVVALDQIPQIELKLKNWKSLDVQAQIQYREWLIDICGNTDERSDCWTSLDAAIAGERVPEFYKRYIGASRELYVNFFRMQWSRQDIVWSQANPAVLQIPFVDPHSPVITNYLRDNIEDEWKWKNWNLRLIFQAGDENSMSHLEFKKAVVPHVEPPNTIVIDENQPFTEYDSRWMIRHEFGHILGFPDCYVEFYDTDREVMISYQLDTTNLMCSRQGQFKQIHFDELKRVYFR